MFDFLLLGVAAFGAGLLNTIAGGGTFLTFPALVFTGIPLVSANATSTVSIFPGYLAGAMGFRREIATIDRRALARSLLITGLGGLIGSALLLVSSEEVFARIVPFLLLASTLVFAFSEKLQSLARQGGGNGERQAVGSLLVAIYGGYFNGGLGIVLLALFSLWGMRDLAAMNGLKNAISFVVSSVSVAIFAVAGIVAWPQAVLMMAAAAFGGYAGAPIARMLPRKLIRGMIISVGAFLTCAFFLKSF